MQTKNVKGEKYVFSCDWLAYSVRLYDPEPDLKAPYGYRLERMQGNNIFRHRAILYDATGNKYLTLLWSPYSPRISKFIMTVQVNNYYLYNGGIGFSLGVLRAMCDCDFNTISRLDICCDFVASEEKINIIHALASSAMYVQGKKEGSNWWHDASGEHENYKMQSHCLSWGSKTTSIRCKLYNKSREQGVLQPDGIPEKPWIVNSWVDMDITKVWRLEFSLNDVGMFQYQKKALSLSQAHDDYFLTRMFIDLYDKRFVVRRNLGRRKGHHNNDPIVSFLRMPDLRPASICRKEPIETMEIPERIKVLRKLMQLCDNPIIMVDVRLFERYRIMVSDVVYRGRLESYFINHYGDDVETFFDNRQAGMGTFDVDPQFDRFFD